MTTAFDADSPARAGSPATASGTRMKPPCAIDEYASMRTMFVWRSAARFPRDHRRRGEDPERRAATSRCDGKNPNQMIVSSATKPPAFDATERNAVTGVGAPS